MNFFRMKPEGRKRWIKPERGPFGLAGFMGLGLILLVGLALSAAAQAAGRESFERASLVVETLNGGRYTFAVEIARTPAQHAQGLMFREQMDSEAGMLFVNPEERPVAFWMKNTFIPLDMLFIRADGRILTIHPMATPHSTESIASAGPVKAVLEINGGLAARLGIRPGDRIRHPAFP